MKIQLIKPIHLFYSITAVFLLSSAFAQAVINYLDFSSLPLIDRTTAENSRLYFDPSAILAQDALSTTSFGYTVSFGLSVPDPAIRVAQAWFGTNSEWTGTNVTDPYSVPAGSTIDSATNFTSYGGDGWTGMASEFNGNKTTYMGIDYGNSGYFGFKINDGINDYFGWVNVTLNTDTSVTYNAIGFNLTPDSPITAETIPEPTTAALLVCGVAVYALRRRRK